MKRGHAALALGVAGLVCSALAAQPPSHGSGNGDVTGTPIAPLGTGQVAYDPGAPADDFGVGPTVGTVGVNYFGNRFDTRNGQPLSAGTLSAVSFYQGAQGTYGGGTTLALPVFGVPGGALTYQFVGPVQSFQFNAFAISPEAVPASFFAGLDLRGNGGFGSVGLRSASTAGQGFHGIQRDFYGATTSTLPGVNVMFRVSGTVVIPVELLEFEID